MSQVLGIGPNVPPPAPERHETVTQQIGDVVEKLNSEVHCLEAIATSIESRMDVLLGGPTAPSSETAGPEPEQDALTPTEQALRAIGNLKSIRSRLETCVNLL